MKNNTNNQEAAEPEGQIKENNESKTKNNILQEENIWLRTLINHIPQVVYETDINGIFTYVNDTVFSMTGYTVEEVINKMHALDFVCPETYDLLKKNIGKVLQENFEGATEYCAKKKNGDKFPVLVKSSTIKRDGKVIGIRGSFTDITNLKAIQNQLEKTKERYRNIFRHTTVGMYRITPEGQILMANPALIKMLGYDSFEEIKKINLIPKGKKQIFNQQLRDKGFIYSLESQWERKDGEKIWVRESTILVSEGSGKIYYDGTVENITNYKKAEESLKSEQTILRKSQELASIGSWMINLKTGAVKVSQELNKLYELPEKDEYTLSELTSRIHPEDQEEREKKWHEALKKGSYDSVYRLLINGQTKWIRTNGEIVYDSKNQPELIYGAVQDITKQKETEQKLTDYAKETALFNEAMVGRELRIIELKEEVNALAKKLHIPQPYPNIWDEKED